MRYLKGLCYKWGLGWAVNKSDIESLGPLCESVVLLAILDHPYRLAAAPAVPGVVTPDCHYLIIPPFHLSLHKSNTLAIVWSLMLLRFGMTFLTMYAMQNLIPLAGKSSKLACLQRPNHHSLLITPASSLVWPGYVIIQLVYVKLRLRVRQLMEIMCYKSIH